MCGCGEDSFVFYFFKYMQVLIKFKKLCADTAVFFARVHKHELLILTELSFWFLFLNYYMLQSGYVFLLMLADTDTQLNYTSNKTNRFKIS